MEDKDDMTKVGYIDTYNYYDYYEKKYGSKDKRLLSREELHTLDCLCETAINNDFDFVLGFLPSSNYYCLHKTHDDKWVVSDCGDRRDGYIYGVFDNIYDASILMINKCANDEEKTIKEFNEKLNNEIDDKKIIKFAKDCNYTYDFDMSMYLIKEKLTL